jgi:hypothetical protein
MKNKPYPALLRPSNLSDEIGKRVPKSRETIPLIRYVYHYIKEQYMSLYIYKFLWSLAFFSTKTDYFIFSCFLRATSPGPVAFKRNAKKKSGKSSKRLETEEVLFVTQLVMFALLFDIEKIQNFLYCLRNTSFWCGTRILLLYRTECIMPKFFNER